MKVFFNAPIRGKKVIGNIYRAKIEKGKLRISHSKGFGSSVNARTFFLANNIDYKRYSRKYLWARDEHEGKELYVVKLQEPEKILEQEAGEVNS